VSDPLTTNAAADLRNAFDRSYAIPSSLHRSEQAENLLAIRLSGDPYAIRVSEISGLVKGRKTIGLPTPIPELLGVAGVRGALIPVYSLATLLGYNLAEDTGGWLALCGNEEPVGLAFRDFEGYLKIPIIQIYAASQDKLVREHIRDVASTEDVVRAIVNIPSILETIKKRCGEGRISKEMK
jgi:chemotaxis signal transduction protein